MKEVTIAVGSKKQFKIETAVAVVAEHLRLKSYHSFGVSVDSGVSDQPASITEARLGARNRAEAALLQNEGTNFGVGIEGGICTKEEQTVVYSAVAIASVNPITTQIQFFEGLSDQYLLPLEVVAHIQTHGSELSEAMLFYVHKYLHQPEVTIEEIRENGAVYYLSEGRTSRRQFMTRALERAMAKMEA